MRLKTLAASCLLSTAIVSPGLLLAPSAYAADAVVTSFEQERQERREARQERRRDETFQLSQYDEEGRLTAYAQDGYISRYSYSADGRRAIRSHGPGSGIFLDATPLGGVNHGEREYTLYVSPFLE